MAQIDKDRFFSMASCYDRMASLLIPHYDLLQQEAVELICGDGRPSPLVVDLGAGSGIFLERVLTRDPAARAVWIDYSDDFRAVAGQRLYAHGDRVRFILSRLEEPWEAQLGEAPDAICSMSAIHHLSTGEKKRLYQRCLDALKPGGWFCNIDEMSAPDPDAYLRTLRYWVEHVERMAGRIPPDLQPHYTAWRERFEKWKQRNLDNAGQAKLPGDDIHESYIDQLHWLRDVGFVDVDIPLKFQLWTTLIGRKPAA